LNRSDVLLDKIMVLANKHTKGASVKNLLYLITTITLLALSHGIISNKEKQTRTLSNSTAHEGYALTPKELALFDNILKEDLIAFSEGADSLAGRELQQEMPVVSVDHISQAYNENQVAADQQYYKKLLFLKGRIQAINSGLGNEPYILLYGINPFLSPQAHFKNGNIEEIVALRKNQKLNLICEGDGAIAGIPIFKNCQFASDYAKQKYSAIRGEVTDFLKGTKSASTFAGGAISLIATAKILPETSSCFTENEKQCATELHALNKNKDSKTMSQKISEVIDELKLLGIQTPEYPNTKQENVTMPMKNQL
jgi:hypothetical protein